jgi:hypothetical protein
MIMRFSTSEQLLTRDEQLSLHEFFIDIQCFFGTIGCAFTPCLGSRFTPCFIIKNYESKSIFQKQKVSFSIVQTMAMSGMRQENSIRRVDSGSLLNMIFVVAMDEKSTTFFCDGRVIQFKSMPRLLGKKGRKGTQIAFSSDYLSIFRVF